jgi:hypothetical protein
LESWIANRKTCAELTSDQGTGLVGRADHKMWFFRKSVLIYVNCSYSAGTIITESWDSAVGIATGYAFDYRGSRSSSRGRVKNFLFSTSSRPALGTTQPLIQWVPGVLSPGLKRPGREADNSPPTNAEVKKMWIYTSTPPYAFMVWYLIS